VFCGTHLADVVKEQYYLSKHANISVSDSMFLPEFERDAYLSLIISDLKRENEVNNKT